MSELVSNNFPKKKKNWFQISGHVCHAMVLANLYGEVLGM